MKTLPSCFYRIVAKITVYCVGAFLIYICWVFLQHIKVSDTTRDMIILYLLISLVIDNLLVNALNVVSVLTLAELTVPSILFILRLSFKINLFWGPITTVITNIYQLVLFVVCQLSLFLKEKLMYAKLLLVPLYAVFNTLDDVSADTQDAYFQLTKKNINVLSNIVQQLSTEKKLPDNWMNQTNFGSDITHIVKEFMTASCKDVIVTWRKLCGPRFKVGCIGYFEKTALCATSRILDKLVFSNSERCEPAENLCDLIKWKVCKTFTDLNGYCDFPTNMTECTGSYFEKIKFSLTTIKSAINFKEIMPLFRIIMVSFVNLVSDLATDYIGTVKNIIGICFAFQFMWYLVITLCKSIWFYIRFRCDYKYANYTISESWANRNCRQLMPLRAQERRFLKSSYLLNSIKHKAINDPVSLLSSFSLAFILMVSISLEEIVYTSLQYSAEALDYRIPSYGVMSVAFDVQGTSTVARLARSVLTGLSFNAHTCSIVDSAECTPEIKSTMIYVLFQLSLTATMFFLISCLRDLSHILKSYVCSFFLKNQWHKRNFWLAKSILKVRKLKKKQKIIMLHLTREEQANTTGIVATYMTFSSSTANWVRKTLTSWKHNLMGFRCQLCFLKFRIKNRSLKMFRIRKSSFYYCCCCLVCEECMDDIADNCHNCIICNNDFKILDA